MFLVKTYQYLKVPKLIKKYGISLLLIILSLWDLRIEIRLLVENFTFTAFIYTLYEHPLAIVTLTIAHKIHLRKY